MKKITILILMAMILANSVCGYEIVNYYKVNSQIDLKVPCYYDNAPCSANSTCDLTILDPDGNTFVPLSAMTNNFPDPNFNYTLNDSSVEGEYHVNTFCQDQEIYGQDSFAFVINKLGTGKVLNFIGIVLGLICIVIGLAFASFKVDERRLKWACMILAVWEFLAAINMLYLYMSGGDMAKFFKINLIVLFLVGGGFIILKMIEFVVNIIDPSSDADPNGQYLSDSKWGNDKWKDR